MAKIHRAVNNEVVRVSDVRTVSRINTDTHYGTCYCYWIGTPLRNIKVADTDWDKLYACRDSLITALENE